MAIELNPANINISSGQTGRINERPRQPQPQIDDPQAQRQRASKPANLNFIPSEESLATQVRSALASRREGRVPDRGSILNLLV